MPALVLLSLFGLPDPDYPPRRPSVEVVVVARDKLVVRSTYPVDHIQIVGLVARRDYFEEFAGDRKIVTLLLRTDQPQLAVVVEIAIPGVDTPRRQVIVVANPGGKKKPPAKP